MLQIHITHAFSEHTASFVIELSLQIGTSTV
jgi:hypothetical protein